MAGAKGIYSEEFKDKIKVTLYFPSWIREKLKYVGNQSVFVEQCIVESTGWKKPRKKKK